MSDEKWQPVLGWEQYYQISELGRLRRIPGKALKKLTRAANGYLVAGLWKGGKGSVLYIHDLVAEAFIGPKSVGMTVNHISGDKLENAASNLEYISLADNTRHQHATGLCVVQGEGNGHAKLTEAQVLEIRARAGAGERTSTLAREFGVGSPIISQIKHRTRWRHLP